MVGMAIRAKGKRSLTASGKIRVDMMLTSPIVLFPSVSSKARLRSHATDRNLDADA